MTTPACSSRTCALYGTTGPVPEGDVRIPLGVGRHEAARGTTSPWSPTAGPSATRWPRPSRWPTRASRSRWWTCGAWFRSTPPPCSGSVARTRRAVVAHHATRFAGFGAEVASLINEELFGELDAPVGRIGAAFAPIGSASTWRPR